MNSVRLRWRFDAAWYLGVSTPDYDTRIFAYQLVRHELNLDWCCQLVHNTSHASRRRQFAATVGPSGIREVIS